MTSLLFSCSLLRHVLTRVRTLVLERSSNPSGPVEKQRLGPRTSAFFVWPLKQRLGPRTSAFFVWPLNWAMPIKNLNKSVYNNMSAILHMHVCSLSGYTRTCILFCSISLTHTHTYCIRTHIHLYIRIYMHTYRQIYTHMCARLHLHTHECRKCAL